MAHYQRRVAPERVWLDRKANRHAVVTAHLVGHRQHRCQQPRHVDGLGVGPRQLGIEPRGIGNIADQPVEAAHIVLDHAEQPAAAVVVARQRQGLDRAAQRGQRVLQLVRHVGGKALDRVDPVVQSPRHVAQRARQMADLVGTVGEVGDLLARLHAAPHPVRRRRQPSDRPRDRTGKQHRQHDHHPRRHQEDAQDRKPLGRDDAVDVAALRRQQQRAAHGPEALDRHCHRHDGVAGGIDADDAGRRARQRPRHLGQRAAVGQATVVAQRQARPPEAALHLVPGALDDRRLLPHGWWQVEPQDVATRIQCP